MQNSSPTQQFVDVKEVRNGVVILKNGGIRRILLVTGINFALKSEEEQSMIAAAYQNFINSLDFSLQMVIHSRKLNIEKYLTNLAEAGEKKNNELLKEQISEYREFIKSFVENNEIMSKTFFVVVPYDPLVIPERPAKLFENIPFFGSKKNKKEQEKSFEEQIIQLDQRTDQVISGLAGIGLRSVSLNDEELVELFYNLYNPASVEKKELKIAKE
ncbi:MAG: hypothetical protein QMD86_01575 [Patescibacteria group bacterium]|nr:hypothetical protein [Patescibacteria group bacterium]